MSGSNPVAVPLIVTDAGPQPTPASTLRGYVQQAVAAVVPDYTANLPGTLIEDQLSTSMGALTTIDQARVDAINSVTPYAANPYVLNQQGAMLGIPQGLSANASVYVTFTSTAGLLIPAGFVVSNGSYQFTVQDGGFVSSTGSTDPLYCVCTSSGEFAIPAGTVTTVVTQITGYTVTCTNALAGTPGGTAETVSAYRSRILQAQQSAVQGTPAQIKTALLAIPGVSSRLVSVQAVSGGWEVICGGGDNNLVGGAIYNSVLTLDSIQGSTLAITGITAANPAVVTTNYTSNLAAGSTFTIAGATPSAYNVTYTVASVSGDQITTTTDSSSFGTYTSGAIFSPNPRDLSATIIDAPDSYTITYVAPTEHVVTISATWNTTLPSFTAGSQVNQLAVTALASYINSIPVGQPINELEMTAAFQDAVAGVLPTLYLTTLTFVVTVDGATATPSTGTSIIPSDPEGYFYVSSSGVTVAQG